MSSSRGSSARLAAACTARAVACRRRRLAKRTVVTSRRRLAGHSLNNYFHHYWQTGWTGTDEGRLGLGLMKDKTVRTCQGLSMPRPTQAPAQGAEDGRRCRALEIALLCRGRGFFRGHNRQTLHDWNPSQMESLSMSPSKPGCLVQCFYCVPKAPNCSAHRRTLSTRWKEPNVDRLLPLSR